MKKKSTIILPFFFFFNFYWKIYFKFKGEYISEFVKSDAKLWTLPCFLNGGFCKKKKKKSKDFVKRYRDEKGSFNKLFKWEPNRETMRREASPTVKLASLIMIPF